MTDRDAFLADIAAKPFDTLPRLVYADFLDESDLPLEAFEQRAYVAMQDVCKWPEKDEPRLEYAALCERYGQGDRGEMILAQIKLTNMGKERRARRSGLGFPDHLELGLSDRIRDLLERQRYRWTYGMIGPEWRVKGLDHRTDTLAVDFVKGSERHRVEITYDRGFPSEIEVPGEFWRLHGDKMAWCWKKCECSNGKVWDAGLGWQSCKKCGGDGRLHPTGKESHCRFCNGRKMLLQPEPFKMPTVREMTDPSRLITKRSRKMLEVPCNLCDGTGRYREPKPMPPTAVPITRVEFTSMPQVSINGRIMMGAPVLGWLGEQYPGITFSGGERTEDYDDRE